MVWVWVVLGIVALAVGVGAGYAVWLYRRARALFVELGSSPGPTRELADLLAQIDFSRARTRRRVGRCCGVHHA